jgi:hypothetical protein
LRSGYFESQKKERFKKEKNMEEQVIQINIYLVTFGQFLKHPIGRKYQKGARGLKSPSGRETT